MWTSEGLKSNKPSGTSVPLKYPFKISILFFENKYILNFLSINLRKKENKIEFECNLGF